MEVSHCVDAALTRARQARLPSPWTEAVDFLSFPQSRARQCSTFLLARAPKIEKIDSLWTGRGIWPNRRGGPEPSFINSAPRRVQSVIEFLLQSSGPVG